MIYYVCILLLQYIFNEDSVSADRVKQFLLLNKFLGIYHTLVGKCLYCLVLHLLVSNTYTALYILYSPPVSFWINMCIQTLLCHSLPAINASNEQINS